MNWGSHSACPSRSIVAPASRQRPPIFTNSWRRNRLRAWLDARLAYSRTRRWLRRISCSSRAVASSAWHWPRRRLGMLL
jgi:hypothetical protein